LQRLNSSATPLPGSADPETVAAELCRERPELDPAVASSLAHTYGSLAADVLATDPDPLVAQVRYARDHEWAVLTDDVLRRRTTLALRGLDTPELRAQVDSLMGHASEIRA
jgi:glycerol-3-phosphate dehydrogenase